MKTKQIIFGLALGAIAGTFFYHAFNGDKKIKEPPVAPPKK